HIDIETDNIGAEVSRLQNLGAVVVDALEKWVVMEAPSGHRFCVIGPVREGFENSANVWR
nr:VOC family protein [Arenicellales bacterium]